MVEALKPFIDSDLVLGENRKGWGQQPLRVTGPCTRPSKGTGEIIFSTQQYIARDTAIARQRTA